MSKKNKPGKRHRLACCALLIRHSLKIETWRHFLTDEQILYPLIKLRCFGAGFSKNETLGLRQSSISFRQEGLSK